ADGRRDASVRGLWPHRSRRVFHIGSGVRRSRAVCRRLGPGSGGAGRSSRTVESAQ
ncbi:hypothetical protein M9458_003127, partial [Cirrhinus mrigala]